MGRCLLLLTLAGAALLGLPRCRTVPATVLLQIVAEAGLPTPDELRLTVFGPGGVDVRSRRLPPDGVPRLPSAVVLYPRDATGRLRVLAHALVAGSRVGEGLVEVQPRAGEQVSATLVLRGGAAADRDGDGVPDEIDNCPDRANPEQKPCALTDGAVADGVPRDAAFDAHGDLDCDKDKDGYRALACGGDDCDDANRLVNPGAKEGPPGSASCTDKLDNDCSGLGDLDDPKCRSCTTDVDCDDKNVCTADSCAGGLCQNQATSEGQPCDDANACTTGTTCKAGKCGGGQAVTCPPATVACRQASCDPLTGCTQINRQNGTGCDDGKYCNEGESCLTGVCQGGKPKDCNAGLPACKSSGVCQEGQKQCSYTPLPDSTVCDDADLCTQGERCLVGSCTPPPLLLELVVNTSITKGHNRAAALDSKNAVHVMLASANLRRFTNASGVWQGDVVDNAANTAGFAALAIDKKDVLHVAYADEGPRQIKYATRAAGSGAPWVISPIATGDGHTALALDGVGEPHVTYQVDTRLYYATLAPGGKSWVTAQIDDVAVAGDQVGLLSAVAVDPGGKIHVAHARGVDGASGVTPKTLRYTTNASGAWVTTEPAGLTGPHGGYPAIALGGSGQVYITHSSNAIYTSPTGNIYLTSIVAGTPKTETFGPLQQTGSCSSLALDSAGKLHVAYRDAVQNQLRYTTNRTGAWVGVVLDTITANTNGYPSLVREASGRTHIVYKVASAGPQKHAVFSTCP